MKNNRTDIYIGFDTPRIGRIGGTYSGLYVFSHRDGFYWCVNGEYGPPSGWDKIPKALYDELLKYRDLDIAENGEE